MAEIERILFDFDADNCIAEMDKLDGILRSSHWSDRVLNYEDEHTILLLRLLQIGGIAVYKRPYVQKTETPEIRRRANDLNMFMNKRHVGQTLLDIADIFSGHEYDARRTIYNSLFFPEIKAYVRYDGLPSDRLLEFLEQDGCEAVMLFADAYAGDESAFYAFMLAMPRELYLDELGEMRGRIASALHEVQCKLNDRSDHVISPLSIWPDPE